MEIMVLLNSTNSSIEWVPKSSFYRGTGVSFHRPIKYGGWFLSCASNSPISKAVCPHRGVGFGPALRCFFNMLAGLSEEDLLLFGNCDSWAIYAVKFKQNQIDQSFYTVPFVVWFTCLPPEIKLKFHLFTSHHPKAANLWPVFLFFWEMCTVFIAANTFHRGIVWDPMPLHRDFRTSGRTKTRKNPSCKDQAASYTSTSGQITSRKTNMTMENQPFEDGSHIKNGDVPRSC